MAHMGFGNRVEALVMVVSRQNLKLEMEIRKRVSVAHRDIDHPLPSLD